MLKLRKDAMESNDGRVDVGNEDRRRKKEKRMKSQPGKRPTSLPKTYSGIGAGGGLLASVIPRNDDGQSPLPRIPEDPPLPPKRTAF